MKEFELKYGCNPNQKPAKIYMADGSELPVKILSGRPGSQCRHQCRLPEYRRKTGIYQFPGCF